jgi:DNA-directed RNA polymerase subunit RPC12/RpoP
MTEKLVCVYCGSKDFYFDSGQDGHVHVTICNGEKIKYEIKAVLNLLNYWYCAVCQKHVTSEQREVLSKLFSEYGDPRWAWFEEEL